MRDIFGFKINSYYNDENIRQICHDVKQKEDKSSYDNAVSAIADFLSSQLKGICSGSIFLVPAPQHTGNAEYTLEIAERMAEQLPDNVKVLDVLKCKPHESLYSQKKNGIEKTENNALHLYLGQNLDIDSNDRYFFIDNVTSTGNTFNRSNELFEGNLFPLIYAATENVKFEMKEGKIFINVSKIIKTENSVTICEYKNNRLVHEHSRYSDGRCEEWRDFNENTGKLVRVRFGTGEIISYDNNGNVVYRKDSKGMEHFYIHDRQGRLIYYHRPDGHEEKYFYREDGSFHRKVKYSFSDLEKKIDSCLKKLGVKNMNIGRNSKKYPAVEI